MTMENPGDPQNFVAEEVVEDDSSETVEEEVIDWKARFEEMEARATKAENDKKAIQGARSKQADQDALLLDIYTRLESTEKSNAALIKALAANDTDNLGDELNGIQSQAAQQRAESRFVAQYQSVYNGILEDATDEDGNKIIDVETDPRLESFRQDIIDGFGKKSIVDITNALPKLHRLIRQIERENAKAAVEKAREEAEESSKSKLRKAGLGDHDLGPGAGGAKRFDQMTSKEKIRYGLDQADKLKK